MFTLAQFSILLCVFITRIPCAFLQTTEPPHFCNVTKDTQGECILSDNCPRVKALAAANDTNTLKKIICGYEGKTPKVCCVTNRTDEALKYSPESTTAAVISDFNPKVPPDPSAQPTLPTSKVYFTTTSTSNIQKQTKVTLKEENPGSFIHRPMPLEEPVPTISGSTQHEVDQSASGQGLIFPPIQTPADFLPNRSVCGPVHPEDKIYGGQIAALDDLPWLARIKYLRSKKEMYGCHGSLVSDRFVVTAAHCVQDLQILNVRLGDWDSETEIDCIGNDCSGPPVDVKVERTIVHPYYNKTLLYADLAILKLATPVNYTEFIRPVCLPTTEYIARQDYNLDSSYVTGGWGKTEFEDRAIVKRKLNLNPVPMSTCRVAGRYITDELAAAVICAGGRSGEDSCAGDSGSSLVKSVSENSRLNWFLYGVTSYGTRRCGTNGFPGLYTRVTTYMEWILSTISSNSY